VSIFDNYDWGLGLQPDDAPAYWGARAILDLRQPKNPIDLLPDRQGGGGPLFSVLASLLSDAGGMKVAQARVKALLNNNIMSSRDGQRFTLIDNDMMKMVADTRGSHGYLYISAWLKPETFDLSDAKWGGSGEPPEAGDTVETSVWQEPVKVLTSINLHGHRFIAFLTGREPEGLDALREWSRPVLRSTPDRGVSATERLNLPHLCVGLTVGRELR
jgi:hypothetical protein